MGLFWLTAAHLPSQIWQSDKAPRCKSLVDYMGNNKKEEANDMPQLDRLLETITLYNAVLVLSSALLVCVLWPAKCGCYSGQQVMCKVCGATANHHWELQPYTTCLRQHSLSRCWLFLWTQLQEKHDVLTFILADTQSQWNMCQQGSFKRQSKYIL